MVVEGFKLLILGMGVVFLFLILLFVVISLLNTVLTQFSNTEFLELSKVDASRHQQQKQQQTEAMPDRVLIAVVSAAVAAYRSRE